MANHIPGCSLCSDRCPSNPESSAASATTHSTLHNKSTTTKFPTYGLRSGEVKDSKNSGRTSGAEAQIDTRRTIDDSSQQLNNKHENITKHARLKRAPRPALPPRAYINTTKSEQPLSYSISTTFEMNPVRLFVASLGNPPPYSSTRHSAGHIFLKALQSQLQLPTFQRSKTYANGLTSVGADVGQPEFTLWQSPSLMNISGIALLKAYKAFTSSTQISATDPLPGLVVLYDEMESTPSQLRLRRGATSAKGHNGLKSVQQSFQGAGLMDKLGDRYVKIGIGIGRPPGGTRSSDDVSQYVLGQLTQGEKDAIHGKTDELIQLLEKEMVRMSK